MITVKTESKIPGGKVRRRYEITLTDLLGNNHTSVLGMFNHDESDNGSSVEAEALASKKSEEVNSFKSEIEQGNNPFENSLVWNSREVLLKAVLDDALTLPATEAIVYNGLPYLQFVTDEELIALYSKDQVWVDMVRATASELLTAKAILDNHQGVL